MKHRVGWLRCMSPSCGVPSLLPSVTPTKEHTCDHSAAELVSGRYRLVPIGLPVIVGDRLFIDQNAVPKSITREDNC